MSIKLSDRVNAIKPSPTMAITELAGKMRLEGHDILSLSAGEPDFNTPDHICKAAFKAIEEGKTKYTAVDGIIELKKAVINKFSEDNDLEYELDQILVSCGGKQSFFNLSLALLGKGDEVIIPAPYWVSYPDIVTIASASPVILQTNSSNGYKITPQQLEDSITDKTRMFVINSPSNPSGQIYSRNELSALAKVLVKYPNIIIASDDMYEHIVWKKGDFSNILNVCPELYNRTIVLNGVSKAYSMTGWRIGYAAGHPDIIKAMKKIQSQSTSGPTSISQYAAVAALNGDKDCILEMNDNFHKRHDFIVDELNSIKGISCLKSTGTFYAFANIEELMKSLGIATDVEFCSYLLEKIGVAVVPGSAFGIKNHIRLSYASKEDVLKDAISRMHKIFS